jgi:TPR repeat protein
MCGTSLAERNHTVFPAESFLPTVTGAALVEDAYQAAPDPAENYAAPLVSLDDDSARLANEAENSNEQEPPSFLASASEPEIARPVAQPKPAAREINFSSYDVQPPRRNYKAYIGAGVILLLGILVYSTWRANLPGAGGRSDNPPPLLPAAAPSSKAVAPGPAKPTSAERGENSPPSAPKIDQSGGEGVESPATKDANRQPAAVKPALSEPVAQGQTGAEELAAAQRYLRSGPEGAGPAVGLLWKAVAKQNLGATLLLSDLYLKGEGVGKSCDQARLLLGAAARKGASAAAQKLATLPSYGCQ